ncbi:hypothetical protein DM01DRAFT_1333647 [Hesseltinella vesiculosa]|uniref:RlpA-like protein double-psi beta-barrel domain-containing protein n=1 Tax=Hesseltinella vesiculosa TaxID=101127 RepID=A0A1X2GNG2_9FUNG|nr:hypothetical protein DM01DRAFT_1333647 [Hesseltinella vesiculosa]
MKFALITLFSVFVALIAAVPVPRELEKRSSYHGRATWFSPASEGGSTGACGPQENDNSPIVALNHPQYGSMSSVSKWCGKKIRIKGPHGTAIARINDACPECAYGSLDLTPAVFKKVVGNLNIGVGKITWSLA